MKQVVCKILLAVSLPLLFCSELGAQPGVSAVRFTEAIQVAVEESVELTGTVDPVLSSVVAGEISGLIVEYAIRQGDEVKEGQLLARLQDRELRIQLREAQAQLNEDEARLRQAERILERTRELLEKGAVSQQALDDAQFEYNAWRGRTERLSAAVEQLEYDLSRTEISAPFAGTVVDERAQVGEWLETGGAVAEILSQDLLEVTADLPERYYARVQVGDRARVRFEALEGLQVTGTVRAVIPRADARSRTFPVKIKIPSSGGRIGSGMMAQVHLNLGSTQPRVMVPKDAITSQQGRSQVFVLAEDRAEGRQVETGPAAGVWIEVRGPVKPGDRVVTRGNERLQDGQEVGVNPVELEYELP